MGKKRFPFKRVLLKEHWLRKRSVFFLVFGKDIVPYMITDIYMNQGKIIFDTLTLMGYQRPWTYEYLNSTKIYFNYLDAVRALG